MATVTPVTIAVEGGETKSGHWHVQGSGRKPYDVKLIDTVWSCSCPAWRNQSKPIDQRVCKHTAQVIAMTTGKTVTVGKPVRKSAAATEAESDFAKTVTLAHTYEGTPFARWMWSEKLDGVRCIWLPKERKLLSRNGKEFYAPTWFKNALPDYPVDGELWIGRGAFQQTVSIVRRENGGDEWMKIKYMVFDIYVPEMPTHAKTAYSDRFAAMQRDALNRRMETIKGSVSGEDVLRLSDAAFLLPHHWVANNTSLQGIVKNVLARKGEGVMLRDPASLYTGGRTHSLLKVKEMLDGTATLIGMEEGEGRHKGVMGAMVLQLPNGTKFKVGTGFTDLDRRDWWAMKDNIPKIVIEFSYQELTDAGVPRFPAYLRVRADLSPTV